MHFASLTEIECSSTVQYSKKSGSGRIHATNHFRALESNFFRNPQMALGFMFTIFLGFSKKKFSVSERVKIRAYYWIKVYCIGT